MAISAIHRPSSDLAIERENGLAAAPGVIAQAFRLALVALGVFSLLPMSAAAASMVEPAATVGSETLPPAPDQLAQSAAGLTGKVHDEKAPLPAAGVYAYRLIDLSLRKVTTDSGGAFSFGALPAGLYKIIAHKPGFLPAVVLLERATAGVFQQLELELRPERFDEASTEPGDFWKIRERIPRDVLREITLVNLAAGNRDAAPAFTDIAPTEQLFEGRLEATQGFGGFGSVPEAELHAGQVGIKSHLGELEIGLQGAFRELDPTVLSNANRVAASSHALALTFDAPSSSTVSVSGIQNRFRHAGSPVDFERVGVSWAQDLGPGRSAMSAEMVEESNFYADPRLEPLGAASASRTWQVEGTYETQVTDTNSLQTGIRYRERAALLPFAGLPWSLDRERFEVFGSGGYDVLPSLTVRYGMLTTLDNGEMTLAPEAGIAIDLGSKWLAETWVRQQVSNDQPHPLYADFLPSYYRPQAECGSAEADCYRMRFTRRFGDRDSLSFGALHRVYGDTLRVFFSDDFFDQLDSLVFVRGDRLPELHLAVSSRLSPSVLARFESNFGSGGGGQLTGVNFASFENFVQYLVTSINTQFESTETGLLLAFHSLQQELSPFALGREGYRGEGYGVDMDRLQLLVTQSLPSLLGLSSDWALRLDMQVSRGGDLLAVANDDELRRRIVGGIAVSF